jgi:hypothetical protein
MEGAIELIRLWLDSKPGLAISPSVKCAASTASEDDARGPTCPPIPLRHAFATYHAPSRAPCLAATTAPAVSRTSRAPDSGHQGEAGLDEATAHRPSCRRAQW